MIQGVFCIFVEIKDTKTMRSKILAILLFIGLGMPVALHATPLVSIMEQPEMNEPNVSVSESTLRVTGASGMTLYIYNVAGVCIKSFKVDSNEKHYDLNLTKGCYIIKVGKVVRKVFIH